MEITIVTDADPHKQMVGGVYNYVNYITRHLKRKGFIVQIIGRMRQQREHKITEYDRFIGIESSNNYVFLLKLLRFFFMDINSDVIYSQRADFMLPFIFKKSRKVVAYHGTPSIEITHKKGFLIGLIYRIIEKIVIKKCDKIIVVSSKTKEALGKRHGVSAKIEILPIGVDLKIFRPKSKMATRKKYGFNSKDKIALYVGRFSEEKQIDFIVQEIAKLKDVKLVLVGEGKISVRLGKNTTLLEPVKHEYLADIINCADCLVMFSKYEGMPTVILEALACAKPVVSSDVGDISKVIIKDKTGFIAKEQDFGLCVQKAISNSQKYKNACIKMARDYSWDKITNKLVEMIK